MQTHGHLFLVAMYLQEHCVNSTLLLKVLDNSQLKIGHAAFVSYLTKHTAFKEVIPLYSRSLHVRFSFKQIFFLSLRKR